MPYLHLTLSHNPPAEGLARVDFFYEKDGRGFLCNEINTIPGFTPISMYPKMWAATGVQYTEVISYLIASALTRSNGVLGN